MVFANLWRLYLHREIFSKPKRICGAVVSGVDGGAGAPSTPSSCLHPANALMLSVRFSLGELKYFLQYHDYNYFGGEFEGVK